MRDFLQSDGEGSLEDRSFTLVCGPNLVEVSYIHFCAESSKIAEVWFFSHIYFKSNLHLVSVTKVAFMAVGGHNFISKPWNNNLTSVVPQVWPLG